MTDVTLQAMLDEQRKTNELLLLLIEALAGEGGEDEDEQPRRYMDGTPVNG